MISHFMKQNTSLDLVNELSSAPMHCSPALLFYFTFHSVAEAHFYVWIGSPGQPRLNLLALLLLPKSQSP